MRPVSIQRRAVSVSSASVQSAAFAELLKRNLSLPEAGGIGAVLYFQLGEKVGVREEGLGKREEEGAEDTCF